MSSKQPKAALMLGLVTGSPWDCTSLPTLKSWPFPTGCSGCPPVASGIPWPAEVCSVTSWPCALNS